MNRNDFIAAYIEAALFADTPEDAPVGAELAPASRLKLELRAGEFYDKHTADIIAYDFETAANAGHDLWYTQNGHGCGYWEENERPCAHNLDCAVKDETQVVDLYIGDDGMIYAD